MSWLITPSFTQWTPALISTALWLDAADANTVTQSSGLVSQINDKSGNNRNFTASGTARPTLTNNGLNGKAVLTFGGSQYLTSANSAATWNFLHNSTGSEVIAVWRAGNSDDPNTLYGLVGTNAVSSSNTGMALWFDDRASLSRNNRLTTFVAYDAQWVVNTTTPDNSMPANTHCICGWSLSPAASPPSSRSAVRVNGGTASQTNTDNTTPTNNNASFTLQVGATGNNTAPLVGVIAELVIASGVLTTTTRERVEGYLAHKWALTANLPSTHPYKINPPAP